jgi:hypothetical protein
VTVGCGISAGGSWRRSALLALSENNIPFDPYSAWAFYPDFGGMIFEDGTRKIYSSGGCRKGRRRLEGALFAPQSPFNQIRHDVYLSVPGCVAPALMRYRARRLAERADRCHIPTMAKTYSIVHLNDTSYGVEITAPDRSPHTVTGFNTEADAQAWMTDQKRLETAAERAWGEGID